MNNESNTLKLRTQSIRTLAAADLRAAVGGKRRDISASCVCNESRYCDRV